MRNVLFIVHGFPPLGGAGVQRVAKFVKYLPQFGWTPVVLTARLDRRDLAVADTSLLRELPRDLAVYRSPCPEPFALYRRLGGRAKLGSAAFSETARTVGLSGKLAQTVQKLLVPDMKVFWLPSAVGEARRIFARHPIEAMVSSSPWETAHLVAARLRELYRVPWVADFRDPWTQASWNPVHPGPLGTVNEWLERLTLRRADAVVVTSQTTAQLLAGRTAGATRAGKIRLIYNGYDESDFAGVAPRQFDRFTIVYAGRAVMPGRGPEALLAGVRRLVERRRELDGRLQIVFIGARSVEAERLVAGFGLTSTTQFTGYLPHQACLAQVAGADLLYLNTIPECIPGKFTEYLRAGRPILAVMDPACEVARLTEELGAGTVVGPQPEAVSAAIEQYLDGKHAMRSMPGETGAERPRAEQFSRRFLTGQLAALLEELTDAGAKHRGEKGPTSS